MRQALGPGALGGPGGSGWGGRWEWGLGWGRHVNPRPFHFNVWQNSLQKKKKKKETRGVTQGYIIKCYTVWYRSSVLKEFREARGNCVSRAGLGEWNLNWLEGIRTADRSRDSTDKGRESGLKTSNEESCLKKRISCHSLQNSLFWILPLLFLFFSSFLSSLIAQLVKNLPAMQETLVRLLGQGRSPGEGIGYPLQYSWASLVAQLVKNLPAMQEKG